MKFLACRTGVDHPGWGIAIQAYSANDGEDEFLEQRALTIGRAVIEQTSDGFGEPERTFFVRHFREGRTLVQIASELGLSRKAARVLGDRVKERLAEALRSARVA
jgi:DNA-directed RNA polymerase specialized sigma24 family protein